MTTYLVYAGGTFDPLHDGHIFYMRLVKKRAAELIEGFDPAKDEIKLKVFVTGSRSYSGKEPAVDQIRRIASLKSNNLLENIIEDALPLTGDLEKDLEHVRYPEHDRYEEPFIYFFGDDQYDTGWAKDLRKNLRQRYGDRVQFYWVQDTYYRERFSSTEIKLKQKRQTLLEIEDEDDRIGLMPEIDMVFEHLLSVTEKLRIEKESMGAIKIVPLFD